MLPAAAALMFPALFILVFAGIPVAFSLLATAFGFGLLAFGSKMGIQSLGVIEGVSTNYLFASIPLFVFMGAVLERSGIARRLFQATQYWVGWMPGGLAVAAILICTIFAASAGVVGAVEVVVGIMAIPAMARYGYDKKLITGTICAGGSLGTMVPPSVIVIIYASVAQMSVGKLFAGIIIPALLMVGCFIAYIVVQCILDPAKAPGLSRQELAVPLAEKLKVTATALLPGIVLIFLVLGTILAGVASPTEAAAVGALGAIVLALLYRQLTVRLLIEALTVTVKLSTMIAFIIVGGTLFTSIFIVLGGGVLISDGVHDLALGQWGIIALFLFIVFLAGFVLDWTSIVLIVVPIFAPIIKSAGIDEFWFAVLVLITIQTAYLTPPMAPSIFYLKGVAPADYTYKLMYQGVIPFIVLQLLVLAIVALVPWTASYLPTVMVGF